MIYINYDTDRNGKGVNTVLLAFNYNLQAIKGQRDYKVMGR